VITISVLGGMGNQMFQYAAAKSLARRNGVELVVDESSFRTYELRSFLLDKLQIPEVANSDGKRAVSEPLRSKNFALMQWRNRVDRVLARLGLAQLPKVRDTYAEPHFHFDPAFFAQGGAVSLYGYFQSERYFSDIADELRRCFQPREPLDAPAQITADLISRSEMPVSVHIRRGDYVRSAETARVHGTLDVTYYKKALSVLQRPLKTRTTVFVFSDDPNDAEAVLDFLPREDLVHVRGDPDRPWEDMALMARCKHHIIANSSFSWWGAWLNPSLEKIVIAPRAWFTPEELRKRNTCDLYPPDWILL
jgi:hypothetical protein